MDTAHTRANGTSEERARVIGSPAVGVGVDMLRTARNRPFCDGTASAIVRVVGNSYGDLIHMQDTLHRPLARRRAGLLGTGILAVALIAGCRNHDAASPESHLGDVAETWSPEGLTK